MSRSFILKEHEHANDRVGLLYWIPTVEEVRLTLGRSQKPDHPCPEKTRS